MGIAGLARRLEPYGARYAPRELDGYMAVVDGPSLAYHAHTLALMAAASTACLPSYADVNRKAVDWLQALESHNIKVTAILFDGALPDVKRDERVGRLERNNRQVRELRNLYPAQSCPIPARLGSVSYSFLAPALREALSNSNYASVTHVVPGEADDWCRPSATGAPRSIIFSNDTDLLLYDYSVETLVVFFKDVELWPEPKFKGYSPFKIGQHLELASLTALAFSIIREPSNTFTAILQDARSIDKDSVQYRDFSRRYIRPSETPVYLLNNASLSESLGKLDVRVSEFVHQAMDITPAPAVYLPLLVEDPNQASAWNIGRNMRLLAYSLLAPNRVMVHEYIRKAQAISVQELKLLSPKDAHAAAARLRHDIEIWLRWMNDSGVPQASVWHLIAVNLVLPELKQPEKVSLLVRVVNGDFDNTWDFIHLTARVQAALYSLRYVKQCACVWLAINKSSTDPLKEPVAGLYQPLVGMPCIADLFIVPGQRSKPHSDGEVLREVIQEMYASLSIEVPPEHISNKKLKKQKREAERKKRRRREAGTEQSNNVFALLTQAQ